MTELTLRTHRVDKEADLEILVGNIVSTSIGSAKYKGLVEGKHVFLYRMSEEMIGFGGVERGKVTSSSEGQVRLLYTESVSKQEEPLIYSLFDKELQEVHQ